MKARTIPIWFTGILGDENSPFSLTQSDAEKHSSNEFTASFLAVYTIKQAMV